MFLFSSRRNFYIVLGIFLLLWISAAALLILLPCEKTETSLWKGYFQFLFESGADPETVRRALEKLPFDEVISPASQFVEYSDYNSLKKILLSDLPSRFIPEDPRYDDYMKRLPLYFKGEKRGKNFDIYYLKTSMGYSETEKLLKADLTGFKWILIGQGKEKKFFAPLFFLLLVCCWHLFLKKSYFSGEDSKDISLLLWADALPTAAALFRFGALCFSLFAPFFFIALGMLLKSRFLTDRSICEQSFGFDKNYAAAFLAVSALCFLFSLFLLLLSKSGIKMFLFLLGGFLLIFSSAAFFYTFLLYRAFSYVHKIFCFLPLKDRRAEKNKKLFLLLSFSIAFSSVGYLGFSSSAGGFRVPVPVKLRSEERYDFDALEALHDMKSERSLPDISDFVSHYAYQLSVPWGGDYLLPKRDESITLFYYDFEKNHLSEKNIESTQFTESFLKDIIIRVAESGLTGLLLSQEGVISIHCSEIKNKASHILLFMIQIIFYSSFFLFFFQRRKEKPKDEDIF